MKKKPMIVSGGIACTLFVLSKMWRQKKKKEEKQVKEVDMFVFLDPLVKQYFFFL